MNKIADMELYREFCKAYSPFVDIDNFFELYKEIFTENKHNTLMETE